MPTDAELAARLKKQLALANKLAAADWSLSMADLAELAPFVAMRAGAEPYHFTLLRNVVRPVSQDDADSYQLNQVSQETYSHLLARANVSDLRLRNGRRPVDEALSVRSDLARDWVMESKIVIRWLCARLRERIPGHCDTAVKKDSARRIFAQARDKVPEFYPKACITRIAIDFAEASFVDGGSITASTLRTYLDRCVIKGLLDCDEAFSLADWDPDDFRDNIEHRLAARRFSARTKGLVLHAYNRFLRFACPGLGIPRVSLASLSREFIGGAGQWRLVSPHAINHLLGLLSDSDEGINRQIAVTIALAFFGGLRASEVRKLTLNDIIIDDDLETLEIEVVRGKTSNARRRIPFHALAGRNALELVKREWRLRREQFSSPRPLSRTAFLGPPDDSAGYGYNSLSTACRAVLKLAFGESANIHMLRHSFCSILFVRWYALRHPDILLDHRDRSHEIYQTERQDKLLEFFAGIVSLEGDARPYDLISLIKITGHATPGTFFVYYVHSYSLVHEHTVMRIASDYRAESFSDKVIQALVPGMRSSASRARLKEKTLQEICRARRLL